MFYHTIKGKYHQRQVEFETNNGSTKMRTCDDRIWREVFLNPDFPEKTKFPLKGGSRRFKDGMLKQPTFPF